MDPWLIKIVPNGSRMFGTHEADFLILSIHSVRAMQITTAPTWAVCLGEPATIGMFSRPPPIAAVRGAEVLARTLTFGACDGLLLLGLAQSLEQADSALVRVDKR